MQGMLPDCPAGKIDSEDMPFHLYTSGTTALPKGVVIRLVVIISTPTSATSDFRHSGYDVIAYS